jgi:RNA-directed DNA polymerase
MQRICIVDMPTDLWANRDTNYILKTMSSIKLTWNDICWPLVNKRLSRLQNRIYKATIEEKFDTVHFLQKKVIHSLDAKLYAVRQTTSYLTDKPKLKEYQLISKTPTQKLDLATKLKLNPKTKITILKQRKACSLRLFDLKEEAKQCLAKLALEPEWEAIFGKNLYGFRPGRCAQDAIEDIRTSITGRPRYLLNIEVCYKNEAFGQTKFRTNLKTIPIIEDQINLWLKAGLITEYFTFTNDRREFLPNDQNQKNLFSGFLINVALNGLESHLKAYGLTLKYTGKLNPCPNNNKSLRCIQYGEKILIIAETEDLIKNAQVLTTQFLNDIGLDIKKRNQQPFINCTTTNFEFLGFSCILLKKLKGYRVKIHISKKSKELLLEKVRLILQSNKASSSYELIKKLRPILITWGNYFKYSECIDDFSQMDNRILGQLRAWVFRRKAQGKNRHFLKEKYFPQGKLYSYNGNIHKNNWVLVGQTKASRGEVKTNHLIKLVWIKSERFIKVDGPNSPFDQKNKYWSNRIIRYKNLYT